MKIEEIRIKNFKIFKDAHIKNIQQMMVLVGANGLGKSTFFDVFKFLQDALKENITYAIEERGGFEEVISRGCDVKKDTIGFEIKFCSKEKNIFTYSLEIGFDIKKNNPRIKREKLSGSPFDIVDNLKSKDSSDPRPTLGWLDINPETSIAGKVLKKVGIGDAIYVQNLLTNSHFCDFQINQVRNSTNASGSFRHLSKNGDNLARVARYLFDNHKKTFDEIITKLSKKISGLSKVEAKKTEDGRIILKFQNQNFKDPFLPENISDGTLKMFAYMILLHDPEPHPLLCIEEPENFLYVDLLQELCEEIRSYSDKGGQVFVSTHSPDFLDGAYPEEVFYITKNADGFSQIKCFNDDKLIRKLAKENKLGYLWRSHYIKDLNLN